VEARIRHGIHLLQQYTHTDPAIGDILLEFFFFLADGSPVCNYKYCRLIAGKLDAF
jgi:hypothetical protein